MTSFLIFIAIIVTSSLSGILGMGGGMILMGILALLLPLPDAMVLHGLVQLVANASRAALNRNFVRWSVLPPYLLGTLLSLLLFSCFKISPPLWLPYMLLGGLPFLALKSHILPNLDIRKNKDAIAAGAAVNAIQLLAGASGAILDLFFLNNEFRRQEIVAMKAMTQTFAHLAKLLYFGQFYVWKQNMEALPIATILFAPVLALVGTFLGGKLLDSISDKQFQTITRRFILVIGAVSFTQGLLIIADL